ncbi:MAG TPA: OmpA family protein [Candidatus Eisenbacteria bacterium]|nr:OmpA family protein [Candidatus Eisenbacteria bacterium]
MGTAPKSSRDPLEFRPKPADSSSAPEPEPPPREDDEQLYQELRELILAPEQQALQQLQQRVDDPESRTEDVGSVVAEAIQLRRKQGGDEALSAALTPTIETALRESVRNDPGTLANALFPVMGPAIRRSILETLRSFLESFNQVLDQSLSVKGLKWRFEALRTGRSFTEVALLHSLVFRVEQVFLIHKKTGLPLGHAVAPAVAMQDPSLVSGMLSAIQDFVRDSFHTPQGQGINRMNVGDLDVWIEQGPYAILACVIRGIAPRDLHDRMAEVLENIHRDYAAQLDAFEGDSSPFARVNPELARCLEHRYREEAQPRGFGFVYATAALLLLLVAGWFGWRAVQYSRWERLVDSFRAQPGYVITSFAREDGKFVVRGMRDPLAAAPGEIIKASEVNPAKGEFHWGGYYALDDSIVQQRATALLSPPAGAKLAVKDGVLQVSGTATVGWVKDVQAKAPLIPGIHSLQFAPELQPDQLAFTQAKSEIARALVRFPIASAALSASERASLKTFAGSIQSLLAAAQALHQDVSVQIVGHTDSTGAETSNLNLSQRRADRVAWELGQNGVPENRVSTLGVGTTQPLRPEVSDSNREFNRSVTFRVVVRTP